MPQSPIKLLFFWLPFLFNELKNLHTEFKKLVKSFVIVVMNDRYEMSYEIYLPQNIAGKAADRAYKYFETGILTRTYRIYACKHFIVQSYGTISWLVRH